MNRERDASSPSKALTIAGAVVLAALALWTMWDLGAFTFSTVVETTQGARSVINTFASVDHPFHATRSDLLLQSLKSGEILRWVASHEGGYPVEFYPLGIAWIDVGLWAALLGQVPIIAIHKLTVALIFVLPGLGFWILARGDRMNPFVPVLALAIHIAVPGEWTQGGRTELVYWGLVANVGGAIFAFVMMAALARWVKEVNRWYGLLAVIAGTAALYTNTRSSIAIVVSAIAIAVMVLLDRRSEGRKALMDVALRIGLVAVLIGLLTAPLLLSMVRYVDLYYFVHFMSYDTFSEIWEAARNTNGPVFGVAAIVGMVVAMGFRRSSVAAITALVAALYFGVIVGFSLNETLAGTIQQLETPRLMPFMRFLAVYMAAWVIGWLIQTIGDLIRPSWAQIATSALVLACAVSTMWVMLGDRYVWEEPYAQPPVMTTDVIEFDEFQRSVETIDALHPEGTAIMVVGDQMSWWHEQLWAPVWSDAMFFYDDWMWYWHPDHEGPYNPVQGHAYPDPALAFTPEWFAAHGVGAVLVTNMPVPAGAMDPRHAAESNPYLEFQQNIGYWDLYLVRDPGSIVTNGDVAATSVEVSNHTINASFESASGVVEIRRNWFPRWQAYANGEQVDVSRTDNGYMQIDVPAGTTEVELRNVVNSVDWLGRLAAVVGVVAAGAFVSNRPKRAWSYLEPGGSTVDKAHTLAD